MRIKILCEISASTQIEIEGQKAWVRSDWLEGDELPTRFLGLLNQKISDSDHWRQPRNRVNHVSRGVGHYL